MIKLSVLLPQSEEGEHIYSEGYFNMDLVQTLLPILSPETLGLDFGTLLISSDGSQYLLPYEIDELKETFNYQDFTKEEETQVKLV